MKLFAVIGNPISHSRSPLIHNSAFSYCKAKNHCYTRILLEDESELKNTFTKLSLDGANITVPFKEEAYRICDELDEYARDIGSVNTIINKNGKLFGRNTDSPGFLKAIESFGNIKSAVILGAGGTTRAVSTALNQLDIDFTILNRSSQRLEFFSNKGFKTSLYSHFEASAFDLLINTTSAGLADSMLPCDEQIFEKLVDGCRFGFDAIYGKKTPFIKFFEKANKPCKDGSDMLLYQAFFAYKSFFESEFDENAVLSVMKSSFEI